VAQAQSRLLAQEELYIPRTVTRSLHGASSSKSGNYQTYTATRIFQRLRAEEGYTSGFTILTAYVRTVRRVRAPAFLTLAFAPGECAQVDWGCAGSMAVGSTRRRLSFFVMVLCYSRFCYVESSLGEATEHFLSAHQNLLNTKLRIGYGLAGSVSRFNAMSHRSMSSNTRHATSIVTSPITAESVD
jgi:hypothetical protein